MKKAIFIDKDGTLIPNIPYNVKPELITLFEGADEALQTFHKNDYLLIIISNQSGVAHGMFTEEDLILVKNKLNNLLSKKGIELNGFYYCPHSPNGSIKKYMKDCDCRKPKSGLIKKAAQNFNINLQKSWMIGDTLHDIEAGNKVSCKTILIDTGGETEWNLNEETRKPLHISKNWKEIQKKIITS